MIPAKKFYMIRHGQSIANEGQYFSGNLDVPLTDLGRAQADNARQIVEALNDKPDYIIHSHLQRARITAEIINTNLKLPISETALIGEHHFGDWEKQPWGDIRTAFHAGENPPNGETHDDFMKRIQSALDFALNHSDGTPLIACHGGVFRAFNRLHAQPDKTTKNCVLYKFTPDPASTDFPWVVEEIS